jgi:phenylpropionate dioxygenase-like ring-hydroxylating dioxygenase large terminal subunit
VRRDGELMVDEPTGLGWSGSDLARVGLRELRGLYTSADFGALEDQKVFRESWSLVASVEQVAPGRYVAVTAAGAPIVLWRDAAGVCRAFHNLCRHRGIRLVAGEGPVGRFVTCPYHQWTFNLDGELVRIPQPDQFPGADPATLGLRAVPVVEWHGMIFVCPSSEPPDFLREVRLLSDRLANHLNLPLREVARVEYTVECNWKLLVENHVDIYHLWYLHQRSLADYQHASFDWRWDGPAWWSWEPRKDPACAGPGLDGLSDEERCGIGAHLLFPNLMMVTTGGYLATYDARPLGPTRTAMTLRVRSTPDADGDRLVGSIRRFLAEDVEACEAMQVAIGSPFFQVGPTAARHEQPVRILHSLLRSKVMAP